MYELKKNGKVLTSKFVGTGPSSYEKKNLRDRGLTKVEKHWAIAPEYGRNYRPKHVELIVIVKKVCYCCI